MQSVASQPSPEPPPPTPDALPELPRVGEAAPPSLEMIKPPERGDVSALKWWAFGIVFYVVFAFIFIAALSTDAGAGGAALLTLVGLGDHPNYPVAVLVVGGIALTAAAAYLALRDIRTIRNEEDDVAWVLKHRREGVPLVFADNSEREGLFRRGVRSIQIGANTRVDTLVDDRVRRMYAAQAGTGGAHVSVEELRAIAEKRTARLGSFTRYASSLLLLLAVLGTFAGVKTALPGLISAVSASGGQGLQNSIVDPLRAVADAFGGNALALVGAIAAGLMAQGLAVGRRHLLERLELASAEYIFDNRRTQQSADPLRAAVEALNDTAQEIRNASGSFGGIEAQLHALGDQFGSAIGSLNQRLVEVVEQQDRTLHEQTRASLGEVRQQVAALQQAVRDNTRAYQGLVDAVGARSAESREAMAKMQEANQALARGLTAVLQLGSVSGEAAAQVETALGRLAEVSDAVERQTAALVEAVRASTPALKGVEETVLRAAERVERIDERAARVWTEAGDELTRKVMALARSGDSAAPVAAGGGGGLNPEAVLLLRRIAAGVETGGAARMSTGALVGLPFLGVLGGAALLYILFRVGALALLGIG